MSHMMKDPVGDMILKIAAVGVALILAVMILPIALTMFPTIIPSGIGGTFAFVILPFAAVFIVIYMAWSRFT